MKTYNVELTGTITVSAENEEEAIEKARELATWDDICNEYVEEIEYDPEFDDDDEENEDDEEEDDEDCPYWDEGCPYLCVNCEGTKNYHRDECPLDWD